LLGNGESNDAREHNANREHWLEGLKLLNGLDTQASIGQVSCPALHIYGGKDNVVPIEAAKNIQELSPRHEVAVIPNAGHLLMLPKQRFLNVIEPFISQVFAGSSNS